ncbi:MAG TPA: hypothetical protein VFU90_16510, partial [Candidatus Tumulicola sp.]|nr:hypothetical protein [Candidatus Tumulicola sp.]
ASAGRQVVGVSDPARLELISAALAALGSRHALVVHGEPGMDEMSPVGCTDVHEVRDGKVETRWKFDPAIEAVPSAPHTVAELAGGSPHDNAAMVERIISGRGTGAAATAVMLNAAAAIYVSARAPSFGDALRQAEAALRDGVGAAALERLRAASRRAER